MHLTGVGEGVSLGRSESGAKKHHIMDESAEGYLPSIEVSCLPRALSSQRQWLPKAADLEAYPVWVRSGKKDALALAQERMDEILATHKPTPLTPVQEQAIEDVLEEARQFYRDRGTISEGEWTAYMQTLESGVREVDHA